MAGIAMRMAVIGTVFSKEWLCDVDYAGAQALKHGLEHMIAGNEDTVGLQLCRCMAVADMPCQAQQVAGVAGADFVELFISGDHFDELARGGFEQLARLERGGLGQVEQQLGAVSGPQNLAPHPPLIMSEHEEVNRLVTLTGRRVDGGDGVHAD